MFHLTCTKMCSLDGSRNKGRRADPDFCPLTSLGYEPKASVLAFLSGTPWSSGGGGSRDRGSAKSPKRSSRWRLVWPTRGLMPSSAPVAAAEIKRLGAAGGGEHGHGGRSMAASSGGQGQGQPEVRQLLNDPRGQAMGLGHLQEAVRQSFEVL